MKLREWRTEDTEVLLEWVEKDPEIVQQIGFKSVTELVKSVFDILQSPNSILMAATNGNEEIVGYVAATNAQADGSAGVHIATSPSHRGKGVKLMRMGLEFAYDTLGLKTLIATVPPGREDVEKFDKHFGFVEPAGKILFMTRAHWEEHNGRRPSK